MAVGDMDSRVLRRLMEIPRGLKAIEKYTAQQTIAADEMLAEIVRGDNPGTQLRAAGYTALADALGY